MEMDILKSILSENEVTPLGSLNGTPIYSFEDAQRINKIGLVKEKIQGKEVEFGERPKDTLKRELLEEVGIAAVKIELQDVDAVAFDWNNNGEEFVVHHIGIFYNVLDYKNEIQSIVEVTEINDDSMGAEFYEIDKLRKKDLSNIAILELEKLGYNLK